MPDKGGNIVGKTGANRCTHYKITVCTDENCLRLRPQRRPARAKMVQVVEEESPKGGRGVDPSAKKTKHQKSHYQRL